MSIEAKTGRRMQISARLCITYASGVVLRRLNWLAGAQTARLHDNQFTRLKISLNFDQIASFTFETYFFFDGFPVLNRKKFLNARESYNRAFGDENSWSLIVHDDICFGERAGAQNAAGVWQVRF